MTNPPFLQSGITAGASEGVSINADIVLESTNIYAAIYVTGAVACGGWEDNI
jgi:hypothetical protein